MAGLQILEAAFEFREVPRSHSGFSDAMTRRETRITLRVQEALRDRLLDYCGPEDIRDCGDGRWLASFPFIADDFGYALLLSLGPGCECLAPLVADTRKLDGIMAWWANMYNESHLEFTILTIIIIPVTGLIFGILADAVMSHIGIDLKTRKTSEG